MVMTDWQARNIEIVQTMAANGLPGNWDVVRPLVADDIVLRVPQSLPWGGTRRGWDGYKSALTIMREFFVEIAVGVTTFDPVDDKIVITTEIIGRVAPTGKSVRMPLLESGGCAVSRSARSRPISST